MTAPASSLVEAFELQRGWCERMGSPLYARLLEVARDDIESSGVVADVVGGFDGDPVKAALALRLMGGVHRLVLMGLSPELARHYPTVGGVPDSHSMREDFLDTVHHHRGYLIDALAIAPQTNEVGRSAALLLALGTAAGRAPGKIRLLEIGAAAGLNLNLDRYRYEFGSWSWGDVGSPVRVSAEWRGPPVSIPDRLRIVERAGCDVAPIDPRDDAARLRVLSFVWADQLERFERTRAALRLASEDAVSIEESHAADWLERMLAEPGRGRLTVVQQSVMWQYVPEEAQARIDAVIAAAGARATPKKPLARTWFDVPTPDAWGRGGPQIAVTMWPGGERQVLGYGQAHGAWIEPIP